jgi:hypothetical protein
VLIDDETEAAVDEAMGSLGTILILMLAGREAATLAGVRRTLNRETSLLDRAYWLGKLLTGKSVTNIKRGSTEGLLEQLQEARATASEHDRVTLGLLRKEVERVVKGRQEAWKALLRRELSTADKGWAAVVQSRDFKDNAELTEARSAALRETRTGVMQVLSTLEGDVRRIVQTEMVNFFQQGQVAERDGEELVYKVPRPTACPHCVRIHLNDDGSSRLYRLRDVAGNSNAGLPAYAWQFTIGPVHPHCYCVLMFQSEHPTKPRPHLTQLKKSLAENSCGLESPEKLFEAQFDGATASRVQVAMRELNQKVWQRYREHAEGKAPPEA